MAVHATKTAPTQTPLVSDEVRNAVHKALKTLSYICDGALAKDGIGFNATDSRFGKALAGSLTLTDKQVIAGKSLLIKYKTQLSSYDETILDRIWGKP